MLSSIQINANLAFLARWTEIRRRAQIRTPPDCGYISASVAFTVNPSQARERLPRGVRRWARIQSCPVAAGDGAAFGAAATRRRGWHEHQLGLFPGAGGGSMIRRRFARVVLPGKNQQNGGDRLYQLD
jgi:hypothetical protein